MWEQSMSIRSIRNEKSDFKGLNALVVEDDAGGMAIIGVMMRHLGIDAFINTTGEGVLEMANALPKKPDIIFLDINLPNTTGYEIIKKLRAHDRYKDITIVAVTAQDADTEIPKCKEAGFNAYVGKPISRMRFPKQLKRILDGESVWETY
jgi:two-component system cell cycle response regulator DivK